MFLCCFHRRKIIHRWFFFFFFPSQSETRLVFFPPLNQEREMLPPVFAYLSPTALPGVPGRAEERGGSQAAALARMPADETHPLPQRLPPPAQPRLPLSGCAGQSPCKGRLGPRDGSCENSCLTFPAAFSNQTTNKEVE